MMWGKRKPIAEGEHMDQYRFAACEEWWLKTLLNPRLGRKEAA